MNNTLLTIRNTEVRVVNEHTVDVGGHVVRQTGDGGVEIDDLREIKSGGFANWSEEEIADIAYVCGVKIAATWPKYHIAYVDGSDGSFDIVQSFTAKDDDAANRYAEAHYSGTEWYVLDSKKHNINGGDQ